jgi:hypothetical protein
MYVFKSSQGSGQDISVLLFRSSKFIVALSSSTLGAIYFLESNQSIESKSHIFLKNSFIAYQGFIFHI